jgi:hypothetical protein
VLDDPAHRCCIPRDAVDRSLEGLQLLAEPAQVRDAPVDVTDLLAQDPPDVLAGRGAGLAQGEDFADLVQAEPQVLRRLDEGQPGLVVGPVDAVPGWLRSGGGSSSMDS